MSDPFRGRSPATVGHALRAMQTGMPLRDASKQFHVPQAVLNMLASPNYHDAGRGRPSPADKQARQEHAYWRRIALGASEGRSKSEARGHARFGEAPKTESLSNTDDVLAQQLLRHMRGNAYSKPKTLGEAAKEAGISAERARRLVKASGATPNRGKRYTLPSGTQMPFFAYGRYMSAVFDKANASIVGAYMNAVYRTMERKPSNLADFVGKTITDVGGTEYVLDTNKGDFTFLSLAATLDGNTFEAKYRIVPAREYGGQ